MTTLLGDKALYADINKSLYTAFTIKKQFIQDENWDMLADCLYNTFLGLYNYNDKLLTAKPIKVAVHYRQAEGNTERFEVEMLFDEKPDCKDKKHE